MSQSHTIEGETTDEAFQEQCLLVRTSTFLTFKMFYMHESL